MAKQAVPMRYGKNLLAAYFVAWTVAYAFIAYSAVNRLDFSHYFEWFVLAWTFQGLEMVVFTWYLSLALFLPLAVVGVFLARWRKL